MQPPPTDPPPQPQPLPYAQPHLLTRHQKFCFILLCTWVGVLTFIACLPIAFFLAEVLRLMPSGTPNLGDSLLFLFPMLLIFGPAGIVALHLFRTAIALRKPYPPSIGYTARGFTYVTSIWGLLTGFILIFSLLNLTDRPRLVLAFLLIGGLPLLFLTITTLALRRFNRLYP